MFISIITLCTGNSESVLNTIFSSVTPAARWPRYYGEVILSLCLKGEGEESLGIQPTHGPNRYETIEINPRLLLLAAILRLTPPVVKAQVALTLDLVFSSCEAFLGFD